MVTNKALNCFATQKILKYYFSYSNESFNHFLLVTFKMNFPCYLRKTF